MIMSGEKTSGMRTQHAFLVAWGWFAEATGLIQKIETISMHQKTCKHSPQGKVLEFLVGTLAGMKHLQELSLAAHPLDRDAAVAQAWGQSGWADYSGVSRTLRALSWEEARAIVRVLEEISQPFLEAELQGLGCSGARLQLDGDLTGLPVSNTSRTYPQAAFGFMDDEIRLGYQAAVVSLASPTYGRFWLSATHHPGDTVSSTQAEGLVLEAERRIGQRPQRRTALLIQRIQDLEPHLQQTQQRLEAQHNALQRAQQRLAETQQQVHDPQTRLQELEAHYQARGRKERPTSQLAHDRQHCQTLTRRLKRRENCLQVAQQRLIKTCTQLRIEQAKSVVLQDRLNRFSQDNLTNQTTLEAEFRLDAGFGAYENVALLAEMGYEVYTKSPSQGLTDSLKRQVTDATLFTRVGANAEMMAWAQHALLHSPYPLDLALERFYTGSTLKHSTLLHYGSDLVTQDLTAWFKHYNGRQLIEAGIKEGKQVFYLHKIKVRSEPAIYLQECCVLFAANFIRWALPWLTQQAQPVRHALDIRTLGIKRQVQVAAHVSALVIRNSEGRFLRFSKQSAFAGKVLRLKVAVTSQLPAGNP